jgi:uncharacterized protein YpmB
MKKSIFPKTHKHKIEPEQLKKYQSNLKRKGKKLKTNAPIETFDSKQVINLISRKSVVKLGVVQGADKKGQKISMLVAYNRSGKIVGKALQTGDPCPPPKCGDIS